MISGDFRAGRGMHTFIKKRIKFIHFAAKTTKHRIFSHVFFSLFWFVFIFQSPRAVSGQASGRVLGQA